jgi:hypothetical protein
LAVANGEDVPGVGDHAAAGAPGSGGGGVGSGNLAHGGGFIESVQGWGKSDGEAGTGFVLFDPGERSGTVESQKRAAPGAYSINASTFEGVACLERGLLEAGAAGNAALPRHIAGKTTRVAVIVDVGELAIEGFAAEDSVGGVDGEPTCGGRRCAGLKENGLAVRRSDEIEILCGKDARGEDEAGDRFVHGYL